MIGVVTEVAQYSFQEGRPQLYVPYSQIGTINDEQLNAQLRAMTLITRTRRPAPEMAASFASAVTVADRNQAISAVRTMEQPPTPALHVVGSSSSLSGCLALLRSSLR